MTMENFSPESSSARASPREATLSNICSRPCVRRQAATALMTISWSSISSARRALDSGVFMSLSRVIKSRFALSPER